MSARQYEMQLVIHKGRGESASIVFDETEKWIFVFSSIKPLTRLNRTRSMGNRAG
jgi:hypothetical protein